MDLGSPSVFRRDGRLDDKGEIELGYKESGCEGENTISARHQDALESACRAKVWMCAWKEGSAVKYVYCGLLWQAESAQQSNNNNNDNVNDNDNNMSTAASRVRTRKYQPTKV